MNDNNSITVCGKLESDFIYSHSVRGEDFFTSHILARRLSDAFDRVPVTASGYLCEGLRGGDTLNATGQLRSYNRSDGCTSHLILTVFCRTLDKSFCEDAANGISLNGFLCKPATFRRTPLGREICDLILAVNRAYNRSDYIPCIAWGRNAEKCAELPVGSNISLHGRLQSRVYQKRLDDGTSENRTAYEVSIIEMENIY